MKIYINNMICNCSKFFVKIELERLGFHVLSMELGVVEITGSIPERQFRQLEYALRPYGLELIDNSKEGLINKIKMAIGYLVDNPEAEAKMKFSEYISSKANQKYDYLNAIFKETTGCNIEKYFITKKIERAIELLIYYNLNLTEITYQLNYNSVVQLSNQFKMITGLTPLRFKMSKQKTNAKLNYQFQNIVNGS